uniref:Terpene synthase metal-binding domain-containing protein n=1 Tax=Fagus sylvatica TaxID=28930 RepID=A0A2N9H4T4_FAGSY
MNKVLLTFAKLDFNLLQKMHQKEVSDLARRMLTKVIAMTSAIDDIYDVYGTPKELELFNQAIERWDISAIVTKDSFEWVFSNPKIVRVCTVVTKLMDDMVSHKFEQKRGHVASAVECYMAQHGATEEEATNELCKQVKDAWKDINEECLNPTTVPMPLLTRILNLARVMDVVYKDEDGYTNAGTVLKDFIASMLIDPVPL